MTLTYLQKMSPAPLFLPGVGHIKSPTLLDIAVLEQNSAVQHNYNGKIKILMLDSKESVQEILTSPFLSEVQSEQDVFSIWMKSAELATVLIDSLSFFFISEETLFYDEENHRILVFNAIPDVIGCINNQNYQTIVDVIKQLNQIQSSESAVLKPRNKTAAILWERMQKAQAEDPKTKGKNTSLTNIVSALSSAHNSYNLTNIWSLTVYQLYDQFFRQSTKNQLDTWALKWAAWGTEPFDFDLWCKSINN